MSMSSEARGTLLQYGGVLVVYVVLGLWLTSWVLNWIVGPLFPLLAIEVAPRMARSLARVR